MLPIPRFLRDQYISKEAGIPGSTTQNITMNPPAGGFLELTAIQCTFNATAALVAYPAIELLLEPLTSPTRLWLAIFYLSGSGTQAGSNLAVCSLLPGVGATNAAYWNPATLAHEHVHAQAQPLPAHRFYGAFIVSFITVLNVSVLDYRIYWREFALM